MKSHQLILVAGLVLACSVPAVGLLYACGWMHPSDTPTKTKADIYFPENGGDLHELAPVRGLCRRSGEVRMGLETSEAHIWQRRHSIGVSISTAMIQLPCGLQDRRAWPVIDYRQVGDSDHYEIDSGEITWELIRRSPTQWSLRQRLNAGGTHRVYIIDTDDKLASGRLR